MAETTNVQVALRVRPLTSKEIYTNANECISVVPSAPNQVCIGADRSFTFDHVFASDANQEDVFHTLSPLLDRFIEGRNAAVLAYGQTGSGKTYTMGTGLEEGLDLRNAGLVYRSITYLFDKMRQWPSESHSASISVSFLELYNEELVDLLNPATRNMKKRNGVSGVLSIREDGRGGVVWDGVQEEAAETVDDVMTFLKKGSLCRTTGSTDMNAVSSRSHAIFSIILKQEIDESGQIENIDPFKRETRSSSSRPSSMYELSQTSRENLKMTKKLVSKLNFVDLAGSERLKRTNAVGDRAKEGISINSGLLALGNVISALGDDTKRFKAGAHVPYRDSKLTRLLQDCLGGNSQTLMMACVSPADSNFMETLSTLKYANRARNIKNKVTVNQDFGTMEINQLRAEVRRLRQDLANARLGGVSGSGSADDLADAYNRPPLTPRSLASKQITSSLTDTALANRLRSENAVLLAEVNKLNWLVSQKESRIKELASSIISLETEKDAVLSTLDADPTFKVDPERSALIQSYKAKIMHLTLSLDEAKEELSATTLSGGPPTQQEGLVTSTSMPNLLFSHRSGISPSRHRSALPRERETSGSSTVAMYGKEGQQINDTLAKAKAELKAEMDLLDEKRRALAGSSETDVLRHKKKKKKKTLSLLMRDGEKSGESSGDESSSSSSYSTVGEGEEEDRLRKRGVTSEESEDKAAEEEAAKTTSLLTEATEELEDIQSQIERRQDMIAALEESQQSVQAMLENHKYEHDLMMQRHDEKIAQLVHRLNETEKLRESLAVKEAKKNATAQDIQSKREADEKIRSLRLELQTKRREADDTRARYAPKIEAQEAMIKKYKVELDRARGDRAKMMKKIREKETAVREITQQKEQQSMRLRRTQRQTEDLKKEMEKRDRSHKLAMKRTQQDFQSKIKSMLKKAASPAKPRPSSGYGSSRTYPANTKSFVETVTERSPLRLFGRGARRTEKPSAEEDLSSKELDVLTKKKNVLEENIKICVEAKHVSTTLEEIVTKRDLLVEEKVALLSDRDQLLRTTDNLSATEQESRLQILSDRLETVEAEIRWFNSRLKSIQSETSSRDMSDWSASYSEAIDLLYTLHRSERKAMMAHLLEEVLGLRAKEASNQLMRSDMEMEMSNLRRTLRVIQNTAVVTQVQTETKAYGFRREVSKRLHTILKKTEETLANSKNELWTVQQVRALLNDMTAMSYSMEQMSQHATPADFGSPRPAASTTTSLYPGAAKASRKLSLNKEPIKEVDDGLFGSSERAVSPSQRSGSRSALEKALLGEASRPTISSSSLRDSVAANEYEQLALDLDQLEGLEASLDTLLAGRNKKESAARPIEGERPRTISSVSLNGVPPFLGGHDVFERLASTHTQASQAKAIHRSGSLDQGHDAELDQANEQQPPPLPSSSHNVLLPSNHSSSSQL